MAKRKSVIRESFRTQAAMDKYLEKTDLGEVFKKYGTMQEPRLKKINLDLPDWLVSQLDLEATRAGVSRQPLIKLWLIQKLEEERRKRSP